jgi:hypothetical protein
MITAASGLRMKDEENKLIGFLMGFAMRTITYSNCHWISRDYLEALLRIAELAQPGNAYQV